MELDNSPANLRPNRPNMYMYNWSDGAFLDLLNLLQ